MRRRALLAASAASGGGSTTIEHGSYYPDLVEYLISKYGVGVGKKYNPVAIEEDIFVGNSFANSVGVGQVKFIHIGDYRNSAGVLLYLENYEDTYYCVAINSQTESEYYGLARYFMWD